MYASLVNERVNYGIDMKSVKSWVPTTSMAWGGSFGSGKYVSVKQYVFTKKSEPISIPHTNVFDDNIELFSLLDRAESDLREDAAIDEQSAFVFAASEFKDYSYLYE